MQVFITEGEKDMIKGCQKRVVWVRNTESDWFDEAYFVLSEKAVEKKKSDTNEPDIITEANRIIAASPFAGYWGLEAERRSERISEGKNSKVSPLCGIGKLRLKWFSMGAAVCAAVSALVMLML